MKHVLFAIALVISIPIFSQSSNFSSDTFTVTGKDLETNTFEKDSTANALVIYELGNSFFHDKDYVLKHDFKQKIKILNRKGFDKSTITIYLYKNDKRKESVNRIFATTHNLENGKVVKTQLKKSEIFHEEYNSNYTLVKFALPNIKEGSVITLSYTLTSPFMYKYKGWKFQSDIPKLYSEYRASIPGNYEYNIKLVGKNRLTKDTSDIEKNCLSGNSGSYADCLKTVYAMENIPAFIDEDYMTTRDNYLSRIEYELKVFKGFDGTIDKITKSWDTADKEIKIDKSIGRQINKGVSAKSLLTKEILNEPDPLKKATLIFEYVQNNYTWNEKYNLFNEESVKDVIESKTGSASKINILLHNLLKECDIDVKPVLLSTRSNGLPTRIYPVISDFNYLVVYVAMKDNAYFLDATDKYLNFGQLPFRCLNQFGRLLDFKNGSIWVNINANNISTERYRVELDLNNDNTANGSIDYVSTGYHALTPKRSHFKNPVQHTDAYQNEYANFEIISHNVETKSKNSNDFKEVLEVRYEPEQIEENIYLNPFLISFFKDNPFKLQERTYPIDFGYKDAYMYSCKINIDEAFEIIDMPKKVSYNLPENSGQLIFNSTFKDGAIVTFLKLNFNYAIYGPEYYTHLKTIMHHVIDIQNNSLIVLKRK